MKIREGDRITYKLAILQQGCHQYEIAMRAGLHESKLSAFLNGRTGLNPCQLARLNEVLGLEEIADVSA